MEYFRKQIPALTIYALILAAWWFVTVHGWVDPAILPSPNDVGATLSGSSTFLARDLKDLQKLSDRLTQPNRAFDIWLGEQLSSRARGVLAGYKNASDLVPLRNAILRDLNRIRSGVSIYEPQRFTEVVLRPETQALISRTPQGSDLELLNRLLIEDAYPYEVRTWEPFSKRDLLRDLAVTGGRVVAALIIAAVIGIPIGLFFGYKRRLYEMVEGPLHALRSVPATCLFPLLLIVIGVGEKSIITLAAYPCLLILMVNSATGAGLAEPSRVRQGKILGLSPFKLVTEVLFFEALPHITAALRTSVSYALVLVVAVEMFIGVGQDGLGRKIFDYQSGFRIPETYSEIIVTGALGVGLNLIITLLEKRLLRWLPQTQEAHRRST